MRADQLVYVLRKNKVAHLAPRVDRLKGLQFQCVPEFNSPVLGAASRSEQPVLVRRPGNRLDGCLVLAEARERLYGVLGAPNKQFVIVASRCELLLVK